MQGTLLGLYPNCLKAVAFSARIAFYRFLRTLLVQPFQRLQAALNKIPYITKLSVMEHLCNTIYDYHPGICHTLNRSGQKVEHFCDSVSNICSIFRTELTTLFCAELPADGRPPTSVETETILFRILPRLERLSHSFYERSTRAYRGIIIGAARPVRSLDIVRKLLPTAAPVPLTLLFERIHAASHPSVFDLVHATTLPQPQRELAWHLTQLLQVHPLPACIAQQQHAALHKRYGDSVRTRQCRMLHVCVQCVARRGTTAGIRLRHDCITNELTCMTCGPGTVLAIDMVGRLAHIAGEYLLLSSCCGAFIFYKGAGCEFATACGEQCATGRQLFRKRERTSSAAAHGAGSSAPTCLVCNARAGIAQTFPLLEPRKREMSLYAVCGKHTVPAHILAHAYTRDDLFRYFALRAQQQRASGSSSRRS
jgi:hypothetical protein